MTLATRIQSLRIEVTDLGWILLAMATLQLIVAEGLRVEDISAPSWFTSGIFGPITLGLILIVQGWFIPRRLRREPAVFKVIRLYGWGSSLILGYFSLLWGVSPLLKAHGSHVLWEPLIVGLVLLGGALLLPFLLPKRVDENFLRGEQHRIERSRSH